MFDSLKDFLIDDWKNIPSGFRFLITLGFLLILNSWLLDHWNPNNKLPFTYLGLDIRALSYNAGFSLILLGIIAIIIRKIMSIISGPIAKYRRKYPIEKLDETFYLIWFRGGKLILFDNEDMKYYHVYPWETAEDLNFTSYGKHIEVQFPYPEDPIIRLDNGVQIDSRNYTNGGGINTQR